MKMRLTDIQQSKLQRLYGFYGLVAIFKFLIFRNNLEATEIYLLRNNSKLSVSVLKRYYGRNNSCNLHIKQTLAWISLLPVLCAL